MPVDSCDERKLSCASLCVHFDRKALRCERRSNLHVFSLSTGCTILRGRLVHPHNPQQSLVRATKLLSEHRQSAVDRASHSTRPATEFRWSHLIPFRWRTRPRTDVCRLAGVASRSRPRTAHTRGRPKAGPLSRSAEAGSALLLDRLPRPGPQKPSRMGSKGLPRRRASRLSSAGAPRQAGWSRAEQPSRVPDDRLGLTRPSLWSFRTGTNCSTGLGRGVAGRGGAERPDKTRLFLRPCPCQP